MLSILLAVAAAMGNATASVLQRKATTTQDEHASALQLMLGLIRTPLWVGGIAAMGVGFLLQAAALATGPIALVQPVLIVELSFTLLLAAAVFHRGLHRREWGAVAGMSIGLAVLLESVRPSGGDPYSAPLGRWLLGTAITLGVVVVLIVLGFRTHGPARAAYLGVATGMGFGFTAALLAAVAGAHSHAGFGGVLTSWQTYLLIGLGPGFVFLLQKALQAGTLVASQPALTLSNPIVAAVFGIAVFHERVRGGGWLALAALGAVLIVVSTLILARSPLLHDDTPTTSPDTTPPAGPPTPRLDTPRPAGR
ncbi:MAG: DMT family transporter [Mycobacteriaceae bacterium]